MRGKHVPTVFVLIAVAISLVVLVLTASMRAADVQWAYVHMAVAAATALFVAFVGIRQCRALLDKGASASAVASSNAFYMGIVWAWGALALVATYATGVLIWKEWWQFLIGFAAAAILSFYFSSALKRNAMAGREDETLLSRSRIVAKVQLVAMVITMLGLLIDGKMWRFLVVRYTDWAANDVFFFGAMAIALISGYALKANKHP